MTKRWAVDTGCGRTFYCYTDGGAQEAVRMVQSVAEGTSNGKNKTPGAVIVKRPVPPFKAREPDHRDTGKYEDDNRKAPGA
jgi:hypothetical protein